MVPIYWAGGGSALAPIKPKLMSEPCCQSEPHLAREPKTASEP